MGYDLKDFTTNGDNSDEYAFEVNVLNEDGVDSAYYKKVYDYVINAADQLYNDGRVPGTYVAKYTTTANLSCNNLYNDIYDWLDSNNFDDRMNLFIVDCDAAWAESSGAWENRRIGVIGTQRYSTIHRTAIVGIQEALHPYVNSDCDKVVDLCNDDTYDDHALGEIIRYSCGPRCSDYKQTPMAASYGENVVSQGECSDSFSVDSMTKELSNCTKKGVGYSKSHAKNNGNH